MLVGGPAARFNMYVAPMATHRFATQQFSTIYVQSERRKQEKLGI